MSRLMFSLLFISNLAFARFQNLYPENPSSFEHGPVLMDTFQHLEHNLFTDAFDNYVPNPPTTLNYHENENTTINNQTLGSEIPSGLIIDFKDGISESDIVSFGFKHGLVLQPNSEFSVSTDNIYTVNNFNLFQLSDLDGHDLSSQENLDAFAAENSDMIEYMEFNYVYQAYDFTPNDAKWVNQWNMRDIGMPKVYEKHTGLRKDGSSVIVAVIDTGVAYEDYSDKFGKYHLLEDFKGMRFVEGYDFVNRDKHANDDNAHGSHVAGTIAEVTNNVLGAAGIGTQLTIMPVKVLSGSGSGTTSDIAEAIRWVADWKGPKGEKVSVINMSLGGPMPSKIMGDAVKYAHKKGVLVVCAAGNSARRGVGYPAAYPDSFAVAATRFDKSTTWYSSWGPEVDIAAPGGDTRVDQNGDGVVDGIIQNTIASQDPTREGYFLFQGTSMASPHVAGVAALVYATGLNDPNKVAEVLQKTAQQVPNMEKERYGAGILNAAGALTLAENSVGNTLLFNIPTIYSETSSIFHNKTTMFLLMMFGLLMLTRHNQLAKSKYISLTAASIFSLGVLEFFSMLTPTLLTFIWLSIIPGFLVTTLLLKHSKINTYAMLVANLAILGSALISTLNGSLGMGTFFESIWLVLNIFFGIWILQKLSK